MSGCEKQFKILIKKIDSLKTAVAKKTVAKKTVAKKTVAKRVYKKRVGRPRKSTTSNTVSEIVPTMASMAVQTIRPKRKYVRRIGPLTFEETQKRQIATQKRILKKNKSNLAALESLASQIALPD